MIKKIRHSFKIPQLRMNGGRMMRMISIITLGTRCLQRAAEFYEALGFTRSEKSDSDIVWFQTGGTVLGLYTWNALADDAGCAPDGGGF
jgi:catechol 2,3-dioxygenase-like lactoylglutathione lyase family enzyme